jgi:hypothetical protein
MKRTRIADWAGADGVVREQAFADCEIIGPVQLVPVGVDDQVLGCEFPFAPDNYAQARGGGGPILPVGCVFGDFVTPIWHQIGVPATVANREKPRFAGTS